jgi:cobalt-zinc-cadmium efflux system outer membrane protein
MRRGGLAAILAALLVAGSEPALASGELTSDEAVAIALARNHDAIAARLDIEAAELDVVAARIYPNPVLSYSVGNLVLGVGNRQDGMNLSPGFFSQPVQAVGLSQVLDVWAKRSARARAAGEGVTRRRLLTEDALREVAFAVRSSFADVAREQNERDLAREVASRYGDTVRLSQARFRAGDISEADLRKIELESTRYENAVIDAETQWDLARQRLAGLLALPSAHDLPGERVREPDGRPTFDVSRLTADALAHRPDLRAAGASRVVAEAELSAAKRERLPDLELGATYAHSDFTVSGDNPNTMALSLSLPLPLFDRNQANVGRAQLDIRRAENEGERLRLAVVREVLEAVRKAARAEQLLHIYEGAPTGMPITATHDTGGMLSRAETALRVAEKSYKAGAVSLLELLEAQRTYLDTRAQYLRAVYDFRQAAIDVTHAVGEGTAR